MTTLRWRSSGGRAYRRWILGMALVAAGAMAGPARAASLGVVFYDQRFGMLDDGTGQYTQVSNLPISGGAAGVAALNGLYYLEDLGNNLFTVDPLTGNSNRVGSTGLSLWAAAFAGTGTGLFEIDQYSDLYSIDARTGAARKVGATGIAAANGRYDTSLASDGTWLYYTAGRHEEKAELYRIDVLTGIAMDLGSTGVKGVAGSAFVNGRLELFQYGQEKNYIYSAVAGSTDFRRGARLGEGAQIIDGGALLMPTVNAAEVSTTVPEPRTWLLSGIGLIAGGLGIALRERRRMRPVRVVARRGSG